VKKVCWISKINPPESKQNNEKIEGHVLWSCLSEMDVWGVCEKRLQKCFFSVFLFQVACGGLIIQMLHWRILAGNFQVGGDLGIRGIILEGNVLKIVNAINAKRQNWNKYGYVVDDSKEVLTKMSE
jgi:hypothetical protein